VNEEVKRLMESDNVGVYKKTYFIMSENTFIRNPKYTINQKMVYQCLQSYTGAVESCFPSKGTIAGSLNIGIKVISKVLLELVELGGILIINQITETNRKSSNLYILAEIDKVSGDFVPESISQFKELTLEPKVIRGK